MPVRNKQLMVAGLLAASILPTGARAQVSPAPDNAIPSLAIRGPAAPGGVAPRTVVPASSAEKPGDNGLRAHSNVLNSVPVLSNAVNPNTPVVTPKVGPPFSGYLYNTPASLACIYALVPAASGCNPNLVSVNATGGSRVIAIVDAYDDPSATVDLQTFSTQFGLPAITSDNFQVVYASGSQPASNFGWAEEESLDVQMAHALAPSAKVVLVEAASNSYVDLNAAVDVATSIVAAAGGGEVSMSYGGSEFPNEGDYDVHFPTDKNVVYFASSGDTPDVEFPSVSKKVISVGGTSISRHPAGPSTGNFRQETTWADAGTGYSAYVPRPIFQDSIQSRMAVPSQRATPDIAAIANPDTGVWIQCSTGCGNTGGPSYSWYSVGGTSVASPVVTALTNNAGNFAVSTRVEVNKLYGELQTSGLYDVYLGTCGPAVGFFSQPGTPAQPTQQWDICSGVGSPRGRSGL